MRPAIILGLGGTGARIVNEVYGKIPDADKDKIVCFVFDTDLGDMKKLKHLDATRDVISIGRSRTVQEILSEQGGMAGFEYLETHRDILGNNMSDGAAQVRMLSRFAFETLRGDAAQKIARKVNQIASNKYPDVGANLYIVSSVCGGTGSGLILPLAFSLKNYLSQQLNRTLLVKAVTLFPDVYALSSDVGMNSKEKRRVRSNAYAFFKEWKTYNDIFRNEYKHKEYLDLLNLKLLDLGSITSLTPNNLVENSDILDPIDIFAGIDAVGAQSTTLQYLKNYEKMTVNYLFLDIVSNIGSETESRLDNALAEFVKSNGMNKFSSFGSASLIYPYSDILKFAPATLMLNSLSDRWMKIDEEYDEAYLRYLDKKAKDADAKEPVLKDFYVQQFDEFVQSGFQQNYYKNLHSTLKTVSQDEYGMQIGEKEYEDLFYERMLGHLNEQIKTRTFDFKGEPKPIVSLADDIKKKLNDVSIENDNFESAIDEVEYLKKAFMFKADKESERIARDLIRNYINMDDEEQDDLDKERETLHNLSHYILGQDQQKPLHPVAVRYFLYKLSKRLKAEKEKLFKIEYQGNERSENGRIPGIKVNIEKINEFDYYEFNDDTLQEDINEAIQMILEKGRGSMFSRLFKSGDLKDVLQSYRENINKETKLILEYYQLKVTYSVLDMLEKRVNLLIEYWEELFRKLKRSINDDRTILRENERVYGVEKQSGEVLGEIKLFDTYDLRKDFIFERLQNSNYDPNEFDSKVSALFYVDALSDFSNYPFKKDKEDIIHKEFEKTILEQLEKELEEKKVFDINIIEALIDEAKLKKEDPKSYIQGKLDRLTLQAGPFMNPAMGNTEKRSFNSWGIHEDSEKELRKMLSDEEYSRLFGDKNVLTEEDSKVDPEVRKYQSYIATPAISKFEIIRSNFDYNFSLTNLKSFSSSIGLNKELTLKNIFSSGGTIYKNYFEQKMLKWNNQEVSNHLDKRWDGLFVLNDINEGVDKLLEKEIKKAFLRGLIMNWFKNYKNNETGEISWKFDFFLEDERYTVELKHQDGRPAGATFYNLYQVLLDNIGLVLKINGYSDQSGYYHEGFFDKQYNYDVTIKHEYDHWLRHKFITEIKSEIPYMLHTGTYYNIFEVVFKLYKEANDKKVKALSLELISMIIDELIDYQKRFGKDSYTIGRVRKVVKDILKKSKCAQDVDCGKELRQEWIETILHKLQYKNRDIEMKKIFLMKKNFYVEDKENEDEENEDNNNDDKKKKGKKNDNNES